MRRHIATFRAADAQGRSHTLHVYVEIIDAGTYENPGATIEGLRSVVTDDGAAVNRLEKGRYEIVTTRQILTSDDAAAL